MKKFVVLAFGATVVSTLFSPVYADEIHSWDIGVISNPGWYDGFWNQMTIASASSAWVSGSENKINEECWFPVDGNTGDWVEVGYHTGYNFDAYGDPDVYSSYSGAFSGYQSIGGWEAQTWPSLGWAPGQNHTLGTLLNTSSTGGFDIRVDGKVVINYGTAYQPSTGNIETGYEWGNSGSAYQTANSLTLYNANVHNSTGWHLLNTMSNITTHDDVGIYTHPAFKTTWVPSSNEFTIQ